MEFFDWVHQRVSTMIFIFIRFVKLTRLEAAADFRVSTSSSDNLCRSWRGRMLRHWHGHDWGWGWWATATAHDDVNLRLIKTREAKRDGRRGRVDYSLLILISLQCFCAKWAVLVVKVINGLRRRLLNWFNASIRQNQTKRAQRSLGQFVSSATSHDINFTAASSSSSSRGKITAKAKSAMWLNFLLQHRSPTFPCR